MSYEFYINLSLAFILRLTKQNKNVIVYVIFVELWVVYPTTSQMSKYANGIYKLTFTLLVNLFM